MTDLPTPSEVRRACRHLWVGDQTQHVQTVLKVLGEVQNMRRFHVYKAV